ncbi:MAG: hypothetical protein JSW34_04640 [Candidatus Zixiibacteriota bacterium]|nr:MAG: hypothetical protein JSW34_04640 [candidate division Zixibacteria bacterium]
MRKFPRLVACAVLLAAGLARGVWAQPDQSIDPEALIERILMVDESQRRQIADIVYDAEYIEGEEKDGEFKEKVRFVKKIYVKYLPDTTLFFEEFIEYYKEGELKSDDDLRKEAKDRKEKKRKRRARDISYSMIEPFYPDHRQTYDIEYLGVADDRIEGRVCHHFEVSALEESDSLINGDYYFEAESFNLVRVDFSPAKLAGSTWFKLKDLSMSITYGPTADRHWLPRQFDVEGKGKAMFFFGVKFAGTEYYRNPVVNGGIEDDVFEVTDGD